MGNEEDIAANVRIRVVCFDVVCLAVERGTMRAYTTVEGFNILINDGENKSLLIYLFQ